MTLVFTYSLSLHLCQSLILHPFMYITIGPQGNLDLSGLSCGWSSNDNPFTTSRTLPFVFVRQSKRESTLTLETTGATNGSVHIFQLNVLTGMERTG